MKYRVHDLGVVGAFVDPATDFASHVAVDCQQCQADCYVRAYGVFVLGEIAAGLKSLEMLAGLKESRVMYAYISRW